MNIVTKFDFNLSGGFRIVKVYRQWQWQWGIGKDQSFLF